ncbi:MAG: hypothetical protein ABJH01_06595 [Algoriphagus sp.]|uniref:hypothetical protein n=1 Tax=Algoriphagus sp. TaxID=1872435 RepID=UPI003290707C
MAGFNTPSTADGLAYRDHFSSHLKYLQFGVIQTHSGIPCQKTNPPQLHFLRQISVPDPAYLPPGLTSPSDNSASTVWDAFNRKDTWGPSSIKIPFGISYRMVMGIS